MRAVSCESGGHPAACASRSASTFSGVMTTTIQSGGENVSSTSTFVRKPRLIKRSAALALAGYTKVVPVAYQGPCVNRRADNLHLARAQAKLGHVDDVVRHNLAMNAAHFASHQTRGCHLE
jgi:hypothetical protein